MGFLQACNRFSLKEVKVGELINFNKKQNVKLLTIKDACEQTGLKYDHLYRLTVVKNEIPYYRVGCKPMVSQEDILTYLDNCYVRSKNYDSKKTYLGKW